MKKTALLLLFFMYQVLCGQSINDMVLEYQITTANSQIALPLGGTVNVTVNWGDGNTENFTTAGDKPHLYSTSGTYTLWISGSLSAFGSLNYNYVNIYNISSLIKVKSFGSLGLTSLKFAFYYAKNLVEVPTTLPNTVTDLSFMFNECSKFDFDISSWDTKNITNMSGMFSGASSFNQPIGSWNTQNVKNMNGMFYSTYSFNQPIGNWNTQNVTNMAQMFYNATSFNQPIGNWNTQNVTDMSYMFNNATNFNQPIGSWDTKNVTSMAGMFGGFNNGAFYFNQPIGNWNTQNVTNMSYMFGRARSFNQPIGNWNTTKVKYLEGMFYNAVSFNQNLGKWQLPKLSVDSSQRIFTNNVPLSTQNYDSLLIGWAKNNIIANLSFGNLATQYSSCEAQVARQKLLDTYKWTITDGGLAGIPCVVTETKDAQLQNNSLVYPLPARDLLHIRIADGSKVELISQQGHVFNLETLDQQINVGALPRGIYILKTDLGKQKVVLE